MSNCSSRLWSRDIIKILFIQCAELLSSGASEHASYTQRAKKINKQTNERKNESKQTDYTQRNATGNWNENRRRLQQIVRNKKKENAPNATQDVDCDANADVDCDSGFVISCVVAELALLSLPSIRVCPQDKSAETDKISPARHRLVYLLPMSVSLCVCVSS